jgi:hypothetical protein
MPFLNGVLLDDPDHLLIADFGLGNLFRLDPDLVADPLIRRRDGPFILGRGE